MYVLPILPRDKFMHIHLNTYFSTCRGDVFFARVRFIEYWRKLIGFNNESLIWVKKLNLLQSGGSVKSITARRLLHLAK